MVILWIQGNILRKMSMIVKVFVIPQPVKCHGESAIFSLCYCHVYKKICFPFFRWNVQNEAIAISAFKIAGGGKHAHMWTLLVVICEQNHRCLPVSWGFPPQSVCSVCSKHIIFKCILLTQENVLNKHFYQAAIIACRLLFTDSIYFWELSADYIDLHAYP